MLCQVLGKKLCLDALESKHHLSILSVSDLHCFTLSLCPNFWQTTMWKVKEKVLLVPGPEHQWKTRKFELQKQTSCCELMQLLENLICLPCPLAPTAVSMILKIRWPKVLWFQDLFLEQDGAITLLGEKWRNYSEEEFAKDKVEI